MLLHCNNSLDGSYINRNIINEAKGPAPVTESDAQNAKQLVVNGFNEKCNEYFRELFHNVDIENQEITETFNLKVRNLLLEIQMDYGFRLHCHDKEYDDVAVWTNLLKISVRSSTPLVQHANHNVKPGHNNNVSGRSSTTDREALEELHGLEEVANQWNRRSPN